MIRIGTNIKKTISQVNESEIQINNIIQAITSDNPLATGSDLIIDYIDVKSWTLKQNEGASFALDILSLIDATILNMGGSLRFLHIQCHKDLVSKKERITPLKFEIKNNNISFCKTSQFTLANIEALSWTDLEVSNIVMGVNEQAVLTVVIGLDKP